MRARPLTPNQRRILDFLFCFISEEGNSPTRDDYADYLGLTLPQLNNVALTLYSLKLKRIIELSRATRSTRWGHGRCYIVLAVDHPEHGRAVVRDVSRCIDGMGKQIPCMCCRAPFMSQHRFNRLCPACSLTASQYNAANLDGGYICNGLAIFSGHVGGSFITRAA